MKRLVYLDVLRGVAILLMVTDHAFDWWLDSAGNAGPWGRWTEFAGTLAAPLFLFLVGIGMALSSRLAERKGKPRPDVVIHFLRRGALLFLSGYLLNLLIFYTGSNSQDIWSVDVLHTIGLSIIFMIPLLWQPAPVILVVFISLFVFGQTAGEWDLPKWLEPFLTAGYFPLALWLPYACFGLAFGKFFDVGGLRKQDAFLLLALSLLSFALIPLVDPAWGYRHPRPIFFLFSIAVLLLITVVSWTWTERLSSRGPLVRFLQVMGQTSLMLYVFHHLVGYRLFWLFGWVRGRSWRGEYGIFTPLQAAWLFLILLILMALFSNWWLKQRVLSRLAARVRRVVSIKEIITGV